jgi:hypothetical protein
MMDNNLTLYVACVRFARIMVMLNVSIIQVYPYINIV